MPKSEQDANSCIFWDGCSKNWHRLMTVPRKTRGGGRRRTEICEDVTYPIIPLKSFMGAQLHKVFLQKYIIDLANSTFGGVTEVNSFFCRAVWQEIVLKYHESCSYPTTIPSNLRNKLLFCKHKV